MNSKAVAIITLFCGVLAGLGWAQQSRTDSIDGNWTVTFTVQGQKVAGSMMFHGDRKKLTGTVETQHTGRGTLTGGAWTQNKLSGIYVFQGHEAIAIAGELRNGKLAGTFRTEGMDGTWQAERTDKP